MYNYLFGTPAQPRKPSATSQSEWFILGAYPSAIHVRWDPPKEAGISAVAVADEPEPFWEGEGQETLIKEWIDALPWNPDWGQVSSPGRLNGSSGAWLLDQVLLPLGIDRGQTWITDCLDIYHESDRAAERLNQPRMRDLLAHLGIKDRNLPSHPSEGQIVKNAQLDRLRRELANCRPKRVITLGNAALRAFSSLSEGAAPINSLTSDTSYGQSFVVRIPGHSSIEMLPLAHPAAPAPYQEAHVKWRESHRGDA